jgi:hypothetical protein
MVVDDVDEIVGELLPLMEDDSVNVVRLGVGECVAVMDAVHEFVCVKGVCDGVHVALGLRDREFETV